ncbi:MAG: DUF308 domain-containing protein [Bacteroides sp.]|nr:DUF308 domain-containing protein [Bacteroidales bacterium]MBD5296075.1 DUF308 domain-containing protein [Bacteroides sp.]
MKGRNFVITYVSALVIGILLLIYHDRAELYNSVVIAIGALIAIPSLILVLMELFRKRQPADSAEPAEGKLVKSQSVATNWATLIAGIAGLALGIWMLCSPAFFIKAIIYTLGAILVLVGIVQIVAVYSAARPLRPLMLWFIIPVLTLCAGVVIILLGPDKISAAAGLVAGISLVVYAANGFAAAGREAQESHQPGKALDGPADTTEKSKAADVADAD